MNESFRRVVRRPIATYATHARRVVVKPLPRLFSSPLFSTSAMDAEPDERQTRELQAFMEMEVKHASTAVLSTIHANMLR